MKTQWWSLPPKAAQYVETIANWQDENGGFRRLPPRKWNVPLSNWVQFCRTSYRNGSLSQDIGAALVELGVPMERALDGIQPGPEAYDKARRAIELIGAAEEGQEVWLTDDFLVAWIKEMQELAAKRPASPLLLDLRDMIPDVYVTCIAPFLGEKQVDRALARGTDAVLEAIAAFFRETRQAPDIRSSDERERQLASWMIRWEHDLVGEHALSAARADVQHELLDQLTTIITAEEPQRRLEQWHWWSICALCALANPEVGNRWHRVVYQPPLASWIRKTGIDPTNNWDERTRQDRAAGRIATAWEVHVALSAAMDHSNATQKELLDTQREQEEYFAAHRWLFGNGSQGRKRGLSRGD